MKGCSRAVNVSPLQIELIPSHQKIKPLEFLLEVDVPGVSMHKKTISTAVSEAKGS
jgi:hypothetical protein